ncbi:MAG: hypothetical protein FJ279_30990, partial [Planctomycetes bacterium]|nr:hypothetical protein [Planctomycetota bacterium]
MKRTCLSLLLVLAWPGVADADEVNLCLAKSGGMATALASVANMNFSAQKACDGQADTGWVAEKGALPVWLRVEWRVPVEIREVVVRLFPKCPFKEVGPVGEYVIEVLGEGMWRAAAGGNAAQMPVSQEIRHTLKSPVRTTAVRLVVKSAPTGQVAVSELEALGPEVALPVEWTQRWQGVWIWCEPSLHIPHREPVRRYMRRSFDLDDPGQVREAWLLACAFDRLNGMWVNSRPALSHGSLCGGSLRRAQVRQIPVEWLVKGENVLAAEVDDLYEVGSHGLLAELVLARKDGTRTVIATDEKWQGQEDQGKVTDWRKPGLSDDRWVACRTVRSPNNRWHWLWNVARPTVAPEDQLKVVELEVSPRLDASLRVESLRPVKPGGAVNVSVAFECAKPLRADYAIVLRLGQPSYCRNHDFELGGAFLRPEEVKTTGWQPGRHEVSVRAPVPEYAPSDTPATLLVSTPSAAAGLQTAVPGTMADEYGLHFTIKVDRGHAPMPTARDFPRCEIRTVAGNPTLHIDGTPVPPILWSSHYGNYQRYSEYAATGVKLFRPFIEGSPICAPGEDASFYPWWFEQV